jgi:hypothetical protein
MQVGGAKGSCMEQARSCRLVPSQTRQNHQWISRALSKGDSRLRGVYTPFIYE